MDWKPYDPAWLAGWLREKESELAWLADALACCTRAMEGGPAYLYFVDPADANQPGAEWQIADNVTVHHPKEGTLVIDVLAGGRVGGIEFLARL